MAAHWEWHDYAGVLSDLLGLGGALALAWPFYNTQAQRDKLVALDSIRVSDDRTARRIREARLAVATAILEAAQQDYHVGLWGALALALAFIAKAGAATQSLNFMTALAVGFVVLLIAVVIWHRRRVRP